MAGKPGETKRWWNPDNLKDVAESVGIANISPESIEALQQEVEYRVFMVIQEAKRFMHAGKRTMLHTTDVSQALKVLEVEPLYGYESTRPLRFGEASLGPGQPLFYIEDEEVDFEKLINAPLPKVPRDMSFTAHWLSIDGVQPSIPQNPTTAESRSQELYPKGNMALTAMAGNETPGMKAQTKHLLSREQRAFFDTVVADIVNEEEGNDVELRRQAAFALIRDSVGLQQLVTYFVTFISEKITHNVKSIFVNRVMMELIMTLMDNEHFFLDPYIPALIPPVTTAICGDRPVSDIGEHNIKGDYELRRMSGQLLGAICKKFDKNPDKKLTIRAVNTVMKAFTEPKKSLAVHYGAIVAYCEILPPAGIRSVFAPSLKTYELVLQRGRQEGHEEDLKMVIAAIMAGLKKMEIPPDMQMYGMGGDVDMDDRREKLVAVVGETIADQILNDGHDNLARALTWDPRKALGF